MPIDEYEDKRKALKGALNAHHIQSKQFIEKLKQATKK